MLIKKKKPWEIPESEATPEEVYLGRRRFLRDMSYLTLGGIMLSGLGSNVFGLFDDKGKEAGIKVARTPTSVLYPAQRNAKYTLDRPLTDERASGTYNNFYEFTFDKDVWRYVDKMEVRPWAVEITGLVEKPRTYDIDQLVRMMRLEERLYRLRCVETWAIAVPWTGFPMRDLVALARPLSSAKYVRMTTFMNTDWAPGQKPGSRLPWPYTEGLTMQEAVNELTLIATGIYGHELPKQHGAPIRLVVPWKHGFKSIKSIVRIEFTDKRPATFWNTVSPEVYGFESNIDPDAPHPWSQKKETMLGTGEVRPTILYNGYGEFVSGIYRKG